LETSSELQTVNVKERVILILKFLSVGAVFWFLSKKGLVTAGSLHHLLSSPLTVLLVVILTTINTILGAVRWRGLLAAKGAQVSPSRALELNLIGNFFNIALPGAVSGDFVKAVFVSKQFPEKKGAVFGSMLLDRFLGVSAMVFVAAFSAGVSSLIDWGGHLPAALLVSISSVGAGILVFLVYMFNSHQKDPLFKLIRFVTKRHTRLEIIDQLYLGVMDYRTNTRAVFLAIAQSVLIHVFLIVMVFGITMSVSATPISIVALAVIVPIGILATAIPVLPAGVGTGHAAFFALFKLVGSDQGAEVFSLLVMFQIIVGMIGGLFYLRSTAKSVVKKAS